MDSHPSNIEGLRYPAKSKHYNCHPCFLKKSMTWMHGMPKSLQDIRDMWFHEASCCLSRRSRP